MSNFYINETWMETRKDILRGVAADFMEVLYELNEGYDSTDAQMMIARMKAEMEGVLDGLEFSRSNGHLLPLPPRIPTSRNWTPEDEAKFQEAMNSHSPGGIY